MSSNKQVQGCLGCLVWIVIIMAIFSSCQYFFNKNQFSTQQSQTKVKTPVADREYYRLMRKGYRLSEQGNCQKSLDFFQKALQRRREDSSALKAIKNMQACVANQTYYRSLKEGDQLIQEENYAKALSSFSSALKQRPNDSRTQKALKIIRYDKPMEFGLQLLQEEDYETALIVFNTVLKLYPNDAKVMAAIKPSISRMAVKHFRVKNQTPKTIPKAQGRSKFYTIGMFLSSELAKQGAVNEAFVVADRVYRKHPNDELAKKAVLELAKQTAINYTQRLTKAK